MLTMQQQMNLSVEYAMFNQRNLTCYWGNRDELTDKQKNREGFRVFLSGQESMALFSIF